MGPMSHIWHSQLNCLQRHRHKEGLDYSNTLLYCAAEKSLDWLQHFQIKLAHFVNNVRTRDHHVVNLLSDIHRLPIWDWGRSPSRWQVYATLHMEFFKQPIETLHLYASSRTLDSSGQNLLAMSRSRTKCGPGGVKVWLTNCNFLFINALTGLPIANLWVNKTAESLSMG